MDNEAYNIEKLKEVLSSYLSGLILQVSTKNGIKNKLSNIYELYPKEFPLEIKDFLDPDILVKNEKILWDFDLLNLLKSEQIITLIDKNNIELSGLLFHLRFKTLNLDQRRILSNRPDISLELIRQYPNLFEFGKGVEMKSVFTSNHWMGKYEFVSNLCTNSKISFDWKFVYDFKEDIDFWYWSLYGKISIEIIKDFSSCFDVYRPYSYKHSRYSDWGHFDHYYFSSAWENLFLNPNIDIEELVNVMGERHFRQIGELNGFERSSNDKLSESEIIDYLKDIRNDRNATWLKVKEISDNPKRISELKHALSFKLPRFTLFSGFLKGIEIA